MKTISVEDTELKIEFALKKTDRRIDRQTGSQTDGHIDK